MHWIYFLICRCWQGGCGRVNSASKTIITDKYPALQWGRHFPASLLKQLCKTLKREAVTNNNDIKTWDRYVDDVFTTVKKDKTEDVLQTINNTTNDIKFTKDEEHTTNLHF